MNSSLRNKYLLSLGLLASVMLFAGSMTSAQAAGQAEQAALDRTDAQATISGEDETTLVDAKTPDKYTVCADAHGMGNVIVNYDENSMNLAPGQCAHLEGAHISAKGENGDTHTHVNAHAHGHQGN
jgi:hypothetical protein